MSPRTELMAASLAGDDAAVNRLGWWQVYVALKGWWEGPPFRLGDLYPYTDALGDEEPTAILEALRGRLNEKWRPKPSTIYRALQERAAKANEGARERKRAEQAAGGRQERRDNALRALAACADAYKAGARPCFCDAQAGSSTWVLGDDAVVRCPHCHGLEQGQVFAAEDEGLLEL